MAVVVPRKGHESNGGKSRTVKSHAPRVRALTIIAIIAIIRAESSGEAA